MDDINLEMRLGVLEEQLAQVLVALVRIDTRLDAMLRILDRERVS